MSKEVLQELQKKKQQVISIVEEARNYGWLNSNDAEEIIQRLERDKLTIGVIGQMKCGKSTFLNSFVFENDILPAATTPMTASLAIITYGEKDELIAEFYTRQEWDELKYTAGRNLENVKGNLMEESKIKAAKELVEKGASLGSSLESYLGTTKTDELSNLIEYVGADGKFISITKSVIIHYNQDYLKGVEIVDTPGFNDPIVSREERTRDFLKHADVVLLMLYAGRPFDATDRDILFKDVALCGIPKVLIGINKYDIPYGNGETMNEIRDYVKEQILSAADHYRSDMLKELVNQVNPIPISAEMALLSKLPMDKIRKNEAYNFAWNRISETFEISTQKQMRETSHIDDLIEAVRKLIKNEKNEILIKKPIGMVLSAGENKLDSLVNEKETLETEIKVLNIPCDEYGQSAKDLRRSIMRIQKRIENFGLVIDEKIDSIITAGTRNIRMILESYKTDIYSYINEIRFEPGKMSLSDAEINHKFDLMIKVMKEEVENSINAVPPKISIDVEHFLRILGETIDTSKYECYKESVDQIKLWVGKLFRDVDWLTNISADLSINVGARNEERIKSVQKEGRELAETRKSYIEQEKKRIEDMNPEESMSMFEEIGSWFGIGKNKRAEREKERKQTILDQQERLEKRERDRMQQQQSDNLRKQFDENKDYTRETVKKQFNSFNPKDLFVNVKLNKENIINKLTNRIINEFLEPIETTLESVENDEGKRDALITERKTKLAEVETSIKKVEKELSEIKQMLA